MTSNKFWHMSPGAGEMPSYGFWQNFCRQTFGNKSVSALSGGCVVFDAEHQSICRLVRTDRRFACDDARQTIDRRPHRISVFALRRNNSCKFF